MRLPPLPGRWLDELTIECPDHDFDFRTLVCQVCGARIEDALDAALYDQVPQMEIDARKMRPWPPLLIYRMVMPWAELTEFGGVLFCRHGAFA